MSFLIFLVSLILIALSIKIYKQLTTGWCTSQVCLVGRTVIVTGANTGIGYETALDLAKRGARVILACRDLVKAEDAKNRIVDDTDNTNIVIKKLDLSSFDSVRKFAKDVNENEERLDVLINNAGMGGIGDVKTRDGFQLVHQTNYLSPFLLTILLLKILKKTRNSRIVNVASLASYIGSIRNLDKNLFKSHYTSGLILDYCTSKLCLILFTIELASKLKNSSTAKNVTTYSLHPGIVITDLFRNFNAFVRIILCFIIMKVFKNPREGAQTTIYLAVQKGIEHLSGEHFGDCRPLSRYRSALVDDATMKKLWEITENIVQLTPEEIKEFNN